MAHDDDYSDANHLGNAIGFAVSRAICDACADPDAEPITDCPCADLIPHGERPLRFEAHERGHLAPQLRRRDDREPDAP